MWQDVNLHITLTNTAVKCVRLLAFGCHVSETAIFRCSHEILLQHLEKINRCRVCIGCESSRWKLLLLYVLKLITSQSSIHPSKFTPDNCFYEAGIESGSWSHNVVLFYWKQFLSVSHAVEYLACKGFLCRTVVTYEPQPCHLSQLCP